MRDTILANVGCLAVFQVAGSDARQLVWELGKERVSEDDIVSLDVHHCYVRATVGTERMPAFSMMVRKPEGGDSAVAEGIRAATTGYTLPARDLAGLMEGEADGEKKVSEYRRLLAERNGAEAARGGPMMRPAALETGLLGLLAQAPFLDRQEMACISGGSRSVVYEAVHRLEEGGLADSIPHAADLAPPARRYCLTAGGVRSLAGDQGMTVAGLLRSRAVSQQWRRILLERLDAVAVLYRLASTIAGAAHPFALRPVPCRFRWTPPCCCPAAGSWAWCGRDPPPTAPPSPSDCGGWARGRCPEPSWSSRPTRYGSGTPAGCWPAPRSTPCWPWRATRHWAGPTPPSGVRPRAARGWTWPTCWNGCGPAEKFRWRDPPSQASLPGGLAADAAQALPALLKPAEKRALDLLADWPWLLQRDMAGLLGVSETRISRLVNPLEGFGLATRSPAAGGRLALTGRGLALLARRDRASVGVARKRWSVNPIDDAKPVDWRNLTGGRSRQLLRNLDHTAAVHGFLSALARQSRALGWDTAQLDPPHRASRHFRYSGALRSVNPDAFGVLRRGPAAWAFFLEWERRAVRPATMTQRLAPYLRYYASHRPTDDHGVRPQVLVVFDGDIPATHFLALAEREMARAGVRVPCGCPTARPSSPWGRWDAPGGLPAIGNPPACRLRSNTPIDQQRKRANRNTSFPSR